MPADKPTELSRIKLKTWTQRSFSPLKPTASWLSHPALAICIFVVVNSDTLAQARDIRIERRRIVFLCWMQDSNPWSQTPNHQQTEIRQKMAHLWQRSNLWSLHYIEWHFPMSFIRCVECWKPIHNIFVCFQQRPVFGIRRWYHKPLERKPDVVHGFPAHDTY